MKNLKYIIGGSILGGALGAKIGEYTSLLMDLPYTIQWIQTSLLLGAVIGLLLTLAVIVVLSVPEQNESYSYIQNNKKSTVGTA